MSKQNILYIGNKLSKQGNTPTGIDIFEPLLKQDYNLKCVSDKKNRVARMIDFMFSIIVNRIDCDLILIDTYSTLNFYYAIFSSLLARLFKIPYILILRGGNLEYRLKSSSILSGILFRKAYCLIAPSEFLKNRFKEYGYNVKVLPTPINNNFFMIKPKQITKARLLWVRKFHSIYNPTMAVKVLKILIDKNYDIKLTMVGPDIDGSKRDCEILAQNYGIEDHIEFTGLIKKDDLATYYSKNNIFINTTNVDNTPLSVLEAMASSLIIISTDVGGIRYLLNEKNAYLVKINDVQEMSNKIIEIIKNQASSIDKISRAKYDALDYKWENLKEHWIDVINKSIRVSEKSY